MRRVKRWLFPILTGFVVLGAAVLPPYLSQLRDARLFGQVHAEQLAADPLPVREGPTLPDRLALYAGQYFSGHPILSFRDHGYFEDSEGRELTRTTQELLTGAEVLPNWLFREEPFDAVQAGRLLLWDPVEEAVQAPSVFWTLEWSYYSNKNHQKSIDVTLDAETGLPIRLEVYDTNMSQWLAYDREDLRALAERFFGLLGVEVREVESYTKHVPSLVMSYAVAGTPVTFHVSRAPTSLVIEPELDGQYSETVIVDGSSAFDR